MARVLLRLAGGKGGDLALISGWDPGILSATHRGDSKKSFKGEKEVAVAI